MIGKLIGRMKCVAGVHERSRHRAVIGQGPVDTSVCRHCGVPMRRVSSKKWTVVQD